jgi:hypothetical protein
LSRAEARQEQYRDYSRERAIPVAPAQVAVPDASLVLLALCTGDFFLWTASQSVISDSLIKNANVPISVSGSLAKILNDDDFVIYLPLIKP